MREHGQYGEGHPFFCVNLPYSVIEERAPLLVPRRDTLCILMDDGDGVAELAHRRLAEMGYTALLVLEGGAPAWAAAGYTLFKGVNVVSKSFGELVEEAFHTPSVSAEELLEMQRQGAPLVMLDGRPAHEFKKMSLPGAKSCPNAELAYRLPELVADESTPVVINCAGRTRSIIGAQSLRNIGLKTRSMPFATAPRGGGWPASSCATARNRSRNRISVKGPRHSPGSAPPISLPGLA
nr:rhodanese-like domain-containing protein [Marinicella sp. W31]MDC2879282.1 rhodanese-like domain-containing protein [Marinicella sp. W31]